MKKFVLFILLAIFALSSSVLASNKISPAIDVLAQENAMVKAGVPYNGEMQFDVDDFDLTIGTNVQAITITSLPDSRVGRLMLDNLYILENQVSYRDDFSMLKFVSTDTDAKDVFFTFKPTGTNYSIQCELKMLKNVNLPPVATNGKEISAWTNKNTSYYGVLQGYDPEGDQLKYEICSYPSKGILYLSNCSTGDYRYVPYTDQAGVDTFSYRTKDTYGNYSEECYVSISIENSSAKPTIADLEDERYLNAIMVMRDFDLMKLFEEKNGTLLFKPDEKITREEFIMLVMKTMGAKNIPTIEKTRFADDENISPKYKGYIESAFSMGIIEGQRKPDGVHFNPKDTITVADASIILNRIIGATEKTSVTAFVDEEEIPPEAKTALKALSELGIFSRVDGKISPNQPLTRAQTAKILMSLLEFRGKIN